MALFKSKKKEELPSLPEMNSFQQSSTMNNQIQSFSTPQDLQNPYGNENLNQSQPQIQQPFFVRIDKFREAKDNLVEIEKKLREMGVILSKLESAKEKEEEEINSWKEDMKEMKEYLESINSSVFNQL